VFFHRGPTHKLCFSTVVPLTSCVFFRVGLLLLTRHFQYVLYFFCLLAWAVDNWSLNHWLFQLLSFEISFVALSGILILESKSLMRGKVCILGHFVLRWHHWAGIWRRLLLIFRSLHLNSKINSPDQATKEISKPNNWNNQWFKLQLPKPGDRRNYKTCWKCRVNDERSTGKKPRWWKNR
jgi:hypothetical protein